MYEMMTTTELARALVGFPVLVTGEDDVIIATSRPLENEFGYPVVGSLRKKPVDILFPPQYRGEYKKWRTEYTEDARILAKKIRGLRRDGSEFDAAMALYSEVINGKTLTYAIISEVVAPGERADHRMKESSTQVIVEKGKVVVDDANRTPVVVDMKSRPGVVADEKKG